MEFLKSAVASAIAKGPLAAYSLGDHVQVDNSIWTVNEAVKREGSLRCTIFSFDINTNRNRVTLAKNAARKLRTLRHPGVIQLIETIETDTHVYLVTERLLPLASYLRRNSVSEETIRWGAWNIAKTVKFINEDASAVHCILRLSSIFTSESGEWKLGGFELLSSTKDQDDSIVNLDGQKLPSFRDTLPPEVGKSGWDVYKTVPWTALDAYGYGSLLTELFNANGLPRGDAPDVTGVPKDMQLICKRLLNANPKLRPNVSQALEQGRKPGGFFQTQSISLSEDIDSLGLKSEAERETFLRELKDVAATLPDDYLKKKLLPELLKSVEFGGGGPNVFTIVLQIGAKLSEEEYESHLTPVLVRLFLSPDRALRICLLENLPSMIGHLSQKIVNGQIYPNLITGFSDVAPLVREQTVKSVLTIIPKLSERTVNGDLLKYLAKTSNDPEPGIRTNTTICLGKIAKYINPGTRSKVLIAAFTRSLRDPFVPARNSALMALAATSDMFSEDDCASKILPCVCPSLVDKEKTVRDQANRTLDLYLQRVRKFSQTMPDTVQVRPSAASADSSSGAARPTTPSAEASWGGWALSTFTSKFASTQIAGDIEPKANSAASTGPTVALQPTSLPAHATRPATLNRTVTPSTRLAQSFAAPEVAEDDDMWGEMDDENAENDGEAEDAWGLMEDEKVDGASKAVSSLSPFPASNLVSSKLTSPTTKYDDGGEPDFAGWLKAQQNQSKQTKSPLPKGLAPKATIVSGAVRSVSVTKAPTPSATGKVTPGSITKSTKPAATPVVKKQPQTKDDEDWGAAWD